MIRRYLFIFLVAAASYYAGYQHLFIDQIQELMQTDNALDMIENTGKGLVEFAKEHDLADKAGGALSELGEKMSD